MALSEASNIVEAVQELQQKMQQIQDTLQANQSANNLSVVTSPPGISWAEAHGDEDEDRPDTGNTNKTPCVPQKVTHVSEHTEQHLIHCMENEDWLMLANSFVLLR